MANVTAQQVKALRDRTGAGMNDCRMALIEADGNEEKAVEIIQKKGLAKAAKKAGAIAAEGLIHSYIHSNARIGVLVEVNCQTDFVARGDEFKSFVNEVALQIASSSPLYVRREEVAQADQDKQLAIFRGQMEEEEQKTGKKRPEAAVAKILEGKLDKWFSEVCLDEQELVTREDKKTVKGVAEELTAKIGEKISVRRFVRYELGEGIEKKATDLAAEVAEQLKGMS
ncbi:translation elongation factor Ts [Sandaracinus amylolyticus]|uniref:Elongation factor Ts n=1 Tax=Sandaracinus amylolyticus TaxID=927083 RepID=A0A0F6W384_9BACT|nr:translation elongation factor Ts [Sandaracinus amylolyticus]AKF06140.1 Translation elongation factor Ts [Sandaracinus amylolyticus]